MTTRVLGRRGAVAGAAIVLATLARGRRARAEPPGGCALGRLATTYARDAEHQTRAFNVELAAEAIDGKSILPGAALSFNAVVGERTAAFGFARSVVLRDRMIAEGMGGGTCQVASTLHAAALLAGLDIVSRAPHSRPSAYIRMGLDATVVYPGVDLKLRNPRADRVVVRARTARGTLDVWFEAEGTERPLVTVTSEILERMPFPRTMERDPGMPDDQVRVKAHGIPGYRVLRTRDIRGDDGHVRRDQRVDLYLPTSEILVASPSLDAARLDHDAIDDEGAPRAPVHVDESGAKAPALVQLRPSTRVILDNGDPGTCAPQTPPLTPHSH